MKKILLVSQVVPQWFVDQIKRAFPKDEIICLTGSDVTGVNVVKTPAYISDSYKTKFASWLRFSRFLKKWYKKTKQDFSVILATSNPPFNSTVLTKLKKKAPFVFVDWDPYPQGIFSYGRSFPIRLLYRIWNAVNNKYYPKIDRIIAPGESIAAEVEKSIRQKISVGMIPISVDTNRIHPVKREENLFMRENKITAKHIILFSGAMGYTKNIELILETANLMKDDQDICFVLIGAGPKAEVAARYQAENRLDNLRLFPLQSEEMFPYSISCGDIAILPEQIKRESTCVPSRAYSMMAAGEALVAITHPENDLAKLITNCRLGAVVDQEDASQLKDALYDLLNNREKLEECQRNARETAVRRFDLDVVNQQYTDLFFGILKSQCDGEVGGTS